MRGDVLALSDGRNPIAFALMGDMMDSRTLCIYVDESGNFGDLRDSSRYCMVTLVFQAESAKNPALERDYADAIFRLGADPDSMVFHSAPLIRQEDQFSAMSRNMRGKLFYQMLSFVRKSDLQFHCFAIDTRFVATEKQIVETLKRELQTFFSEHGNLFDEGTVLRVFYDGGQKGVSHILDGISEGCPCAVVREQRVSQGNCRMLQVADFICTVKLIGHRLDEGLPLNLSEQKFFGSPRTFERNILRKIKSKEI